MDDSDDGGDDLHDSRDRFVLSSHVDSLVLNMDVEDKGDVDDVDERDVRDPKPAAAAAAAAAAARVVVPICVPFSSSFPLPMLLL